VLEGVIHQMVQGIAPMCEIPLFRAIHLEDSSTCRLKCPAAGISGARLCQRVPHLVFHMSMD
jgi:hypothetical protein